MVTITREQKNGQTSIRIAGTIDEHVDLQKLIGAIPPKVNIICKEVVHINSIGVKGWIEFFSRAAASKIQFTFSDCPPAMVEHLNYITQFACGGAVISVSVPFICETCHVELRGTVKSDDLKKVVYKVPPIQCPNCKSKAVFDDSPEEYFAFLIRQDR